MNLQELINAQRALTDAARAENRSLTADEQRQFDEYQRQIDAILNGAGNPAQEGAQGQGERGHGAGPQEGANGANPQGNATREAALQERQRINEITELCRNFNIDSQHMRQYIDQGMSLDQVRAAVLEQLRGNGAPISIHMGETGAEKRAAAISDALIMRSGMHLEHPAQGAEDFRGASLRQIAASCLGSENKNTDYSLMDASRLFDEVTKRSYLTPESSFPSILDQTIEKAYVEGWRTAPVTFDQFVTIGTLSDFKKSNNRYVAGAFGDFLEVKEGGELKHFVPEDEKLPTRQLKTYGRQFTLSRQAFIDDDIGLITRLPAQAAAAARRTQNKQVFQVLVNNPKIYDGTALFGSNHKNLLKIGTGVTREAVEAMILALGGHKTKDGDAILIRPAVIVVPLGYKFDMYTLFNSATIDNAGTVNPLLQYRDSIKIAEDATLNALVKDGDPIPWFMFGDQSDSAAIEVDYLNGQQLPNVRRMEVSGQLGFVWDFYLDWGVDVQDFRGVVKNPGVKVESPLALA